MYNHEQIKKNLTAREAQFIFGEDGGAGDLLWHFDGKLPCPPKMMVGI